MSTKLKDLASHTLCWHLVYDKTTFASPRWEGTTFGMSGVKSGNAFGFGFRYGDPRGDGSGKASHEGTGQGRFGHLMTGGGYGYGTGNYKGNGKCS